MTHDRRRYDKDDLTAEVVKGEMCYPRVPVGTLVWFWPGARPEGRKVLGKTMTERTGHPGFNSTPVYRVEFYDDDGGLHTDYIAWTHVEPVYPGEREECF